MSSQLTRKKIFSGSRINKFSDSGTNVVIAGKLVGGVYSQTEVALHQATISLPSLVCTKTCALVANQDKSCDANGYVNAW